MLSWSKPDKASAAARGVKRNAAIREQKRAAEQGRVRDVLREYADMLRGSAVAGKGDPPPAPSTPP